MSDPILRAKGVKVRFGGFVALDGIDLDVAPGERLGLIGPNGSGKSTFVNCLAGELAKYGGNIHFLGEALDGLTPHERVWLGLSRTFQLPRPFFSLSVIENIIVPLRFSTAGSGDPDRLDERAAECLDLVGLLDKAEILPRDLNQVDLRKLELARALAARPQLLIADEAMAGLSHSEVDQILELLLRLNDGGMTIIMIEHVMRAVTIFSQRLVVFVAGRKVAEGNPKTVLENPEVEAAYLGY